MLAFGFLPFLGGSAAVLPHLQNQVCCGNLRSSALAGAHPDQLPWLTRGVGVELFQEGRNVRKLSPIVHAALQTGNEGRVSVWGGILSWQ